MIILLSNINEYRKEYMLDKISENSLFNSIENIKGIGPKTLKLFKKLCGKKIIDLLLTIPRNYKKRKYIQNISDEHLNEEIALIVNVIKHLPQFHPKMPSKYYVIIIVVKLK